MYLQKLRYAKYGNRASDYNGYIYDSAFEAEYAQELDLRLKAKDIKSWQRQVKCSIDIGGMHICNYICDFEIEHHDGSFELVETKGLETEIYRIKRKLLEAVWLPEHPDHNYTVVKQGRSYLWNRRRK
jgi:hypothetical protein